MSRQATCRISRNKAKAICLLEKKSYWERTCYSNLKFNEPIRFKREERKIGCIRGGQCKLNEIFHEEECMLLGHSCGSKMKLVLIGTIYTNESWKCSMQCKCINGYIEISGGCSEITNNYVSTKNFLFLV